MTRIALVVAGAVMATACMFVVLAVDVVRHYPCRRLTYRKGNQ